MGLDFWDLKYKIVHAIEGKYDEIVLDFENKYEIPKMERNLKMEIKTEIKEIDPIDPSTLNHAMVKETHWNWWELPIKVIFI